MNALEPFIRGNSAVYQVGDNTISISVEEIDPVTAQQYLDTAHNNRTLSNVERFAIDVVAQRWVFTGEPVIFNEDNELMDGNNRLRAVIAGGKPIQTLVVRGVDTKARPYIDTGKSRTLVDVLVMEAACEKYHQAVGYILKRLVCLANNRPVIFRSSTTRAEELSMLKKSKREIVDAVTATYS